MVMKIVAVAFVFALVAGCVSQGTYNQEVQLYDQKSQQADTLAQDKERLQAQNKAYEELNQKLATEVKADEVQIQQLKNKLKVTMMSELLFREGGVDIDKKGKDVLDKMIPVLQGLKDQRIQVQGFTDNVGIGAELKHKYPTNWELSAARACTVVRYFQHKGISPKIMEATGFSEYQPVAPNDTPQGRHKNRRIEVILVAVDSVEAPK